MENKEQEWKDMTFKLYGHLRKIVDAGATPSDDYLFSEYSKSFYIKITGFDLKLAKDLLADFYKMIIQDLDNNEKFVDKYFK